MSDDVKYSTSLFIGSCMPIPTPVFWDTHTSIYNKGLPITTITGDTGTGKTFATQLITTHNAIMGKTVVALDYKGDLLKIYPLRNEIGVEIRIWDISAKNQNGVFDPFSITNDPQEQISLSLELITLLIGSLSREDRAAIMPVIKDIAETDNPSLLKVVMALRSSQDPTARGVGGELHTIRSMPNAGLFFYSGKQRRQAPPLTAGGLTIATLAGLDLPQTPEEAQGTASGRLSSGILFILCDYIRRLLKSSHIEQPKLFVIDEAWAVLNTEPGRRIVKEVGLLGRSKNVATLLTTQSPLHFEQAGISNTIGTRFMFEGSPEDSEISIKHSGLPVDEGFEDLLTDLPKYSCVMAGYNRDFALMRFSTWKTKWIEAFRTNPYDHMMKAQQEKLAAKASSS